MRKLNGMFVAAALVALSVSAHADDQAVPKPAASFDLHDPANRTIIASTAATQFGARADELPAQAAPEPEHPAQVQWQQPAPPTSAPPHLDHIDCDAHDCVARDQYHQAMYSVDRNSALGRVMQTAEEERAACQSHDDILAAEQRTAQCPERNSLLTDEQTTSIISDVVGSALHKLFH